MQNEKTTSKFEDIGLYYSAMLCIRGTSHEVCRAGETDYVRLERQSAGPIAAGSVGEIIGRYARLSAAANDDRRDNRLVKLRCGCARRSSVGDALVIAPPVRRFPLAKGRTAVGSGPRRAPRRIGRLLR